MLMFWSFVNQMTTFGLLLFVHVGFLNKKKISTKEQFFMENVYHGIDGVQDVRCCLVTLLTGGQVWSTVHHIHAPFTPLLWLQTCRCLQWSEDMHEQD